MNLNKPRNYGGKPRKLNYIQQCVLFDMYYDDDFSNADILEHFGISERSMYYYIKRHSYEKIGSSLNIFMSGDKGSLLNKYLVKKKLKNIYGEAYPEPAYKPRTKKRTKK